MISFPSDELTNWIPWKLSGSSCNWLYLSNKKFAEPFFSDTISAIRNLNENCSRYQVISDLEIMTEWSENITALTPSAIIFHVSRCGSTLLSQLLSLDEPHIVLSEVPFLDDLLRLPYKDSVDTKIVNNYLSAAIKFYGQKRNGKEKHLFIKTDSWHLHFHTPLRDLFPSVPFILLFRNPKEVIISHQMQRGMQSVPGLLEPEIFGFNEEKIKEPNLDVYMTNVLASYFKKIIEISKTDKRALLFNYSEGIDHVLKKIAGDLDLNITKETGKLIYERSRFHAKHPQQLFAEDYKEFDTNDFMIPVMQLYMEIEDIRFTRHLI